MNAFDPEVKTEYRLYEKNRHELLTDKLTFIFLELKKFNKTVEEINGNVLDRIYCCMKHMPTLNNRPDGLDHDVFRKIFEVSELLDMDEDTCSR